MLARLGQLQLWPQLLLLQLFAGNAERRKLSRSDLLLV